MPDRKPQPDTPAADSKAERAMLLRDAVEHSVRVEQEAARPQLLRRSRAGRGMMLAACVAVLGFSIYSWIARPEFIWGPRQEPISPERAEASMRIAMFLIAQRLEGYRAREGEYPSSLAAVDADTSFSYILTDDTRYELAATVGDKRITLASGQDLAGFLGNSRELVQQRVGQ